MMLAPKTRREMIKQLGAGMGTIGLAGLMADKGLLAPAAHLQPLEPLELRAQRRRLLLHEPSMLQ